MIVAKDESRAVRAVRRWVGVYTGGLSSEVGERRRLELDSDIWEQLHGPAPTRSPGGVLGRCLRGVPADVWWRYRTLLDQRGAQQRSHTMTRNVFTNWWGVITAVLGGIVLVPALALLGTGVEDGNSLLIATSGGGVVAGTLLLGGLAVKTRHPRVGTWMIVIGAAGSVLVTGWLIVLGIVVIAGGFWTGHLQLSDAPGASVQLVSDDFGASRRWYLWLIASLVLFAVGFGALVVLGDGETATGDDDTSVIVGLAWFGWVLGWLGAIITLAFGVALGAIRALGRHHTRPA
jgi:hypothetical protein